MATFAPMARVPFAPLDNPRLQHLTNAKNRQNGISDLNSKSLGGKASLSSKINTSTLPVTGKRSLETSLWDDLSDGENHDPSVFASPSKKTKKSSIFEIPSKPFSFTVTPPSKSMLPPSSTASLGPKRFGTPVRTSLSSARTPSTAPAGRSPPRKTAGVLKNRRIASYARIDPPVLARNTDALPFSLDAAISGSMGASAKRPAATIQESMPRAWAFDIYEETPEEEAQNLMEHYAGTLDLSSDNEDVKAARNDRGKENTPPAGYDAAAASRPHGPVPSSGSLSEVAPSSSRARKHLRKKVLKLDEIDDGQRSPLSDLETEEFFGEGLTCESHVIVDEAGAEKASLLTFLAPAEKVEE